MSLSGISSFPSFAIATLAAQDPDAAPAAIQTSLIEYIHAGGFLSYVLILLSIVALALAVRNLVVLRLSQLAPPEVVHALAQLLRDRNLEGARQFCAQQPAPSFLIRVFGPALDRIVRSPLGLLDARTAFEESGQAEVERLHRLNDGLGIIAAVGPMLGLLGTVIGMIGAFQAIGSLEGAQRSSELAKFMSLALVCTAEGLVVAVPCTVAFALFRRRIDALVADVGRTIEELSMLITAPRAATGAARGAPVTSQV